MAVKERSDPTRAEIEAVPHTRAQLAQWGVSWPPPKGWKRRLLGNDRKRPGKQATLSTKASKITRRQLRDANDRVVPYVDSGWDEDEWLVISDAVRRMVG